MKTCALFLLFLCFGGSASAHNNYFLPGDSFFSVSITRDVIKKWMENSKPEFEFEYSRFDGEFIACGNIGYSNLKVHGIDSNFKSALSEAYWSYSINEPPLYRLEDEKTKKQSQVNGVVALIYNADFDGPFGLKFNEDWQTQGAGRYCGLFEAAKPVIFDWQLGSKFPPLKLDSAPEPLEHIQPGGYDVFRTMEKVLTTEAKNIKIVLVGFVKQDGYAVTQKCPNLQRIFDEEENTEYVTVDLKGFTTISLVQNEGWKENRIDTPVPAESSNIPKVVAEISEPDSAVESKK